MHRIMASERKKKIPPKLMGKLSQIFTLEIKNGRLTCKLYCFSFTNSFQETDDKLGLRSTFR